MNRIYWALTVLGATLAAFLAVALVGAERVAHPAPAPCTSGATITEVTV